ncbi:uncharacterized protein LOC131020906 isoform X2 [Salvia miltiorrhiza]|uniref:uncharacterized protein LOC131020906 isoform X2 n=1 Tax=Salvia miltiorrhiza TaxID=226208 RepID=UPI0025AC636C|nr:uncharacterized protein LOC131020906 isoform X2 [Salvia miltiorrhiza]
MAARFKELIKKYGKVGIVVHCSISAASISGIYVAIKNNVDVESMIERTGLDNLGDKMLERIGFGKDKSKDSGSSDQHPETMMRTDSETTAAKEKNRTKELAASSGSALALAILLNKALIPVRIPITLAVTPAVARFLARRKLMKSEASEVVNGHWIGSVREGGNFNGVKGGTT